MVEVVVEKVAAVEFAAPRATGKAAAAHMAQAMAAKTFGGSLRSARTGR